jgi:D-glycero-beta-D-manno-heptose 1-phosphate adenylyltransferase
VSAAEKVATWAALLDVREEWRREGRIVVWTNGVFDLLHVGHVRSLEAAKALGDVLVVGVNADESVRELKGPDRPLVGAAERAEVVAGLASVDRVVVFDEPTPERVLAELQPDVHAKGADYAPPDGKPLPERELVESYGGRIEFLPFVPARSTTDLVERIRG